jgi:hypothetical protein
VQLEHLDEIRMTQRCERGELAVQSGGLFDAGLEELLQREARSGTQAIFNEDDPTRPSDAESTEDHEPIHAEPPSIMSGIYGRSWGSEPVFVSR